MKLVEIAERMKREARRYPQRLVEPPRPLANGALLILCFARGTYWLRIARKGLSPLNDFSPDAARRLRAWQAEVRTFRDAFGVPPDARGDDGAQELYYFVDVAWHDQVSSASRVPLAANAGPASAAAPL